MAIKIEKEQYRTQPIQVVQHSDRIASAKDSIGVSWGNIASTMFKKAAMYAPERGQEAALAVPEDQLLKFDPVTKEFNYWNPPKNMGTLASQAYKKTVGMRIEQSINNELKNEAQRYWVQYSNKPNFQANWDSAFGHHLEKMSENSTGRWKEYIATAGNQLRASTNLKILEEVNKIELAKNQKALELEVNDTINLSALAQNSDEFENLKNSIEEKINIAAESDNGINAELLIRKTHRKMTLSYNISQLNSKYRNLNDPKWQGKINDILYADWRKNEQLIENLPEELQAPLKSIVRRDISQEERNGIIAQISQATTDINRVTQEDINSLRLEMNDLIANTGGLEFQDYNNETLQTGDPSFLAQTLSQFLGEDYGEEFLKTYGDLGGVASTGLENARVRAVFNAATAFRRSLDKPTSRKIRVASQAIGGEISLENAEKTKLFTSNELKAMESLSDPNVMNGTKYTEQFASALGQFASTQATIENETSRSGLNKTQLKAVSEISRGEYNPNNNNHKEIASTVISTISNITDLREQTLNGEIHIEENWRVISEWLGKTRIIPKEFTDLFKGVVNQTITDSQEIENIIKVYAKIATVPVVNQDGSISNVDVLRTTYDRLDSQEPKTHAILSAIKMVYEVEEGDYDIGQITNSLTSMSGKDYYSDLSNQLDYEPPSTEPFKAIDKELKRQTDKWLLDYYGETTDLYTREFAFNYAKFLLNTSNNSGDKPKKFKSVTGRLEQQMEQMFPKDFRSVFLHESGNGKFINWSKHNLIAIFGSVAGVHTWLDTVEQDIRDNFPEYKGVFFDRSKESVGNIFHPRGVKYDHFNIWGMLDQYIHSWGVLKTGVNKFHDMFVTEEAHWHKPDDGFKGEFKLIAHTDGLNNGIVTVAYLPADGEILTLENGTRVTGPQILRINRKVGDSTIPEPLSYNLNEAEDLSGWEGMEDVFVTPRGIAIDTSKEYEWGFHNFSIQENE